MITDSNRKNRLSADETVQKLSRECNSMTSASKYEIFRKFVTSIWTDDERDLALLKFGFVSVENVKKYAQKISSFEERKQLLESILPDTIENEKTLREKIGVGRKKMKTLVNNRTNVIAGTPRLSHKSKGTTKVSYEEALQIFRFFIDNATPVTGHNSVTTLAIDDNSLQNNPMMRTILIHNDIETETFEKRGIRKEKFVTNIIVSKISFIELHRNFAEEKFQCSRSIFLKFKPFFCVEYTSAWSSMCWCDSLAQTVNFEVTTYFKKILKIKKFCN